jgi:solute:Na+ symporter, SSS family
MSSGLSAMDLVVIGVYCMLVIGIGVWSARHVKSQEDYFLAGRRFGKFFQTFAIFGSGTHVESPVGVASMTFTNGAAGIWSSLVYLFVTPIYWLIAPWMRRLRVLTMADYLEERYGSKVIAALYASVAALVLVAHLAVGFSAASKTVMVMLQKGENELTAAEKEERARAKQLMRLQTADYVKLAHAEKEQLDALTREAPRSVFARIDTDLLMWIICAVVLIYGMAGGWGAAVLSDTVQGLCIIVMSVMLFPFCWARINVVYGGKGVMDALETVHARLPESFFEVLGSPTLMDFTWFYVAALSLLMISNTPPQAHFLTSLASAKNEYACRFGATWGAYIKRFCSVLWGCFALCALVIYYDKIHDPDLLWGYGSADLLGAAGVGLVGLMIACLMAALMSATSLFMITCSALLTQNVYRPLLPNRSEKHYVLVGRISGGASVVVGVVVATQFDSILQLLKFMWEINIMVAAMWWLGMKWRRANRAGAWSSMVVAATFFFLLPVTLPAIWPSLRSDQYLLRTTESAAVTRTYRAHAMDVEQRQAEMVAWESLLEADREKAPRPAPLSPGATFTKSVMVPAKSVFWTKGLKQEAGRPVGAGMLNLELVAIDRLGMDLSKNSYAVNETIRVLIRTIAPFLVLIVVSLITRPEDSKRLDRFFARMRTVVSEDREADAREVALSYAQPDRFKDRKMFPGSQWEFFKWNRVDTVGFLAAVACVFLVVGFLKLLLMIGA